MNILLIGNGFDLAHGLPTKYDDFLEWVHTFKIYGKYVIESERFGDYVVNMFETENPLKDEILSLICDNVWIEYFESEKESARLRDNWVDFEKEISKLVKSLDEDMTDDGKRIARHDIMNHLTNDFLYEKFSEYTCTSRAIENLYGSGNTEQISFGEIIDKLYVDLNRITRVLEIYLSDYIGVNEPNCYMPDIVELKVDKVLSFNYTDTYFRVYGARQGVEYDYIHGRANIDNSIDTNDMVLGIDEYLPTDRKDNEIDFIAFKKYYQRIYKGTGSKYKEWIESIIYDEHKKKAWLVDGKDHSKDNYHYLYIFGHSLDVTDKDVLRDLILHNNVETTIYYYETIDENGNGDYGRTDLGKKIANLVKIIGQDELIRRTGGTKKTIFFKLLADRVDNNPL